MKLLTEADRDALSAYARLDALTRYDLTHPDLVEELDAIAAHSAETLGRPIAMTNLLLDTAAVVKGSYGLDEYGDAVNVPIEWSLCVRTVRSGVARAVPDLSKDPEEFDNPLVVHEGVRSYAGAPLRTLEGQVIGTHCVIGREPSAFSEADLSALTTAALEVVTTLDRYLHE